MSKFNYQRGEVYLVEEHGTAGHEQKKTRPWVLVGATAINTARSTVIAIPLSTKALVKPPLSINVYYQNTHVTAVIDQLRALDKRRFIRHEGQLDQHEMDVINESLKRVLSI